MIAATSSFGVGQVVYSVLWFMLFFVEIWLMISIFIDIFRSDDLSGGAKALWVLLVLLLPIIGIIAYFIFRGDKMRVHQQQAQQQAQRRQEPLDHLPHAGSGESPAQELSRLADLKREGMITDEEYETLKADVVKRTSSPGGS
jgi:hypothetical protein